MSVKSRLMTQSGEHWAAEDGGEDNGDFIVFLVPPVPNYAAPPPPVSPNVSPRPSTSSYNGAPPSHTNAIHTSKQHPTSNAHSVPPHRPPTHNAPPIPTKTAPSAPKKDIRNSNGLTNSTGTHNVPFSGESTASRLAPSKPAPPTPTTKSPVNNGGMSPGLAALRNHPMSNTVAALPSLENKKAPHPSSTANAIPSRPSNPKFTGSELSIKPMILVPVLPVGPGGIVREQTSLSPRELAASNGAKPNGVISNNASAINGFGVHDTSPRDGNYGTTHARSVSVSANMQPAGYQLPTGAPTKLPSSARDRAVSAVAGGSLSISGPTPQSRITAPSTRPGLRVDDSISDNRVIQEIVITHEDYVQDLCLILSVFALPMKERSIVSSDVHDIFFEGIETLISVEQVMMRDLKGKKGLKPIDVALIFQANLSSLHSYIPFCSRQDRTLKLMTDQLTSNPAFASFCEEVRKVPECRGLSFDAFIIKPLQRLCKLPLLFRELSKSLDASGNSANASSAAAGGANGFSSSLASLPSLGGGRNPAPPGSNTPSSTPSVPVITEERRKVDATQFMLEQILDEINQSTGDADKLVELERNLVKKYPNIATLNLQHRKLLLDGEIAWVVKESKDQVKLRMGHFWLLDQVLLFCRSPKELDFIMPLNTVSISKNLPPVQNFNYVLELSDMTATGLITRKLCVTDQALYHTLITKLS